VAKKRTPSAEDLKERVITIVRSRKRDIGDVERELKKLYQDYFARVREHLGRELSRSEQLNIKATTEMMRSLTDMLDEAGKPEVLKSYREKFNGLADDALGYFSAFGESTSKAGVSREAIKAYSKFAETELAKSIDTKLVGPIQSALLQANYGSYTRAQLVDNLVSIEPTLTTNTAVVLVDDAFSQFQRAIIVEKGDSVDLEIYQYLGPDDDITSPQCQHMLRIDTHGAEGILYKDEINADLHENLRENPLIAGGHKKCRHQWTPVTLDYAVSLGFEPR
jgi:hypothetical protein